MQNPTQVSNAASLREGSVRNRATILLVDDDSLVRRALRVTCMSAGYTVVEAATGEEAVEKVQANSNLELVLLDLRMPGFGGLEACRGIRMVSDIPILVISILRDPEDRALALEAGADDYLVKPFSIHELLSHIAGLQSMARLELPLSV